MHYHLVLQQDNIPDTNVSPGTKSTLFQSQLLDLTKLIPVTLLDSMRGIIGVLLIKEGCAKYYQHRCR